MNPNLQTKQPTASNEPGLDRTREPTRREPLGASGWFAISGGFLLAVDGVAHLFVQDTVTSQELLGLPHELWHLPGVVGIMAAMFGLIGIHLRQATRAGKLGQAGFVLLMVGVTLGAAYSIIFHGVFLPSLERLQEGLFEEFIDNGTSTAQLVRGITVQALGLGIGAILFGVATIRARVLPRIGGWLMIAAAISGAAQEGFAGAQLISRLLFAATFLVLGSALVTDREHEAAA